MDFALATGGRAKAINWKARIEIGGLKLKFTDKTYLAGLPTRHS